MTIHTVHSSSPLPTLTTPHVPSLQQQSGGWAQPWEVGLVCHWLPGKHSVAPQGVPHFTSCIHNFVDYVCHRHSWVTQPAVDAAVCWWRPRTGLADSCCSEFMGSGLLLSGAYRVSGRFYLLPPSAYLSCELTTSTKITCWTHSHKPTQKGLPWQHPLKCCRMLIQIWINADQKRKRKPPNKWRIGQKGYEKARWKQSN